MAEFNEGDRIKVDAFEAKVVTRMAHRGCMEVQDDNGYFHFVYPYASSAVTVTNIEPLRPEREIVRDGDDDVFIYEPSEDVLKPWRLVSKRSYWESGKIGGRYEDAMLTRPLTVLG